MLRRSRRRKVALSSFIRRVLGRAQPTSPWDNHEPIREELFSVERIEEHARSLAIAQPVAARSRRGHPLAGRLSDNAAALHDAYRRIERATDEGRAITPAAEWLIDNYHLVEKQIREIRTRSPGAMLTVASSIMMCPSGSRIRTRSKARWPSGQSAFDLPCALLDRGQVVSVSRKRATRWMAARHSASREKLSTNHRIVPLHLGESARHHNQAAEGQATAEIGRCGPEYRNDE